MYKKLHILFIVLVAQLASAQRYELGVFLGGSNPIADIGRTHYVYPNEFAFGGLFKWNFHERMSARVQITKTAVSGNDAQSDIPGKRNRQFSFRTDVIDMTAGVEWHFFSYKIKNLLDRPITPYVFGGITGFWHDDLYFDPAYPKPTDAIDTSRRDFDFAVPVAFGVKAKITNRLVLAGEVMFHFTFTNNLDGTAPKRRPFVFGNIGRSYDWYTLSGLTLTYTFGEWPCYCRN